MCKPYQASQICAVLSVLRHRRFQYGTLPEAGATVQSVKKAEVAQLVEQLIRNQQVVGSSPTFGSTFK
jgi:hypothetical protein